GLVILAYADRLDLCRGRAAALRRAWYLREDHASLSAVSPRARLPERGLRGPGRAGAVPEAHPSRRRYRPGPPAVRGPAGQRADAARRARGRQTLVVAGTPVAAPAAATGAYGVGLEGLSPPRL
ncbi:MAG: hypothetical protein AVDCRST_MAG01-01-59, partial [uncultured Rubrobacteraceae bacterium]